jgi:predicted component of viral defense system (DUF524 family)
MQALSSLTVRWQDAAELHFLSEKDDLRKTEQALGFTSDAKVFGVLEMGAEEALSALAFVPDPDGIFQPIRLLEETTYQLMVELPFSKEECIDLKRKSGSSIWPFANQQLQRSLQIALPRLWSQVAGSPRTQIPVFLNARSQAGCIDLSLYGSRHALFAEVMTAKIGYEDEFRSLLEDVANEQLQLAFEVGASSGLSFRASSLAGEDLISILFHLRRLMGNKELPAALERILSGPSEEMISEEVNERRLSAQMTKPSVLARQLRSASFTIGGPLAQLFNGMSPDRLPGYRRKLSFDTAENRFVKHFLLNLEHILMVLKDAADREKRTLASQEISGWTELVHDWLSHSLWKSVKTLAAFPSNSQKLQRASGYQDVLAADTIIKQALAIPWSDVAIGDDVVLGDVKAVSELYEYWCFFRVRTILQELYGPDELKGHGLTVKSKYGLSLRLAAMTDGRGCIFKLPAETGELHLFYNRRFLPKASAEWGEWSGSYSIEFDPDISIAIKPASGPTHWLNFDAKYKLQRFRWNSALGEGPTDISKQKEYKQDDLNKMHCYRDAILGTRGSFILYPGSTDSSDVYVRKGAMPRRAEGIPSVGAFPLRPGNQSQRQVLKEFIKWFVTSCMSASGYNEEQGLVSTV